MKIRDAKPGVLTISGSIDFESAGALRQALLEGLNGPEKFVADLTQVDLCDTVAIQVLLAAQKSAASSSRSFELKPSPMIEETAAALGLPLFVAREDRA